MAVEIKILAAQDSGILESVADGVFDDPLVPASVVEFLDDSRHHLVVAIDAANDEGQIVGFASAVDYLHPDKTTKELWINEVGVAPTHQRQGIGKSLLRCLLAHATDIGCSEAWVLTDGENTAAMALYASMNLKGPPEDAVMFSFPLSSHGSSPGS